MWEEQARKLKANWIIGLENGKLARMSIGVANFKSLKEREGYRATLTNILSIAQETLLLRSFDKQELKQFLYHTTQIETQVILLKFSLNHKRKWII